MTRRCVELSAATNLPWEYFRDMDWKVLSTYVDVLKEK